MTNHQEVIIRTSRLREASQSPCTNCPFSKGSQCTVDVNLRTHPFKGPAPDWCPLRKDTITVRLEEPLPTPSIKDVAEHFEVAPSTVFGWLTGEANPHPTVVKKVMQYLLGFLPIE